MSEQQSRSRDHYKRKRRGVYKDEAKAARRRLSGKPPRVIKSQATIKPGDGGIFATCVRGRENKGLDELAQMLDEACNLVYPSENDERQIEGDTRDVENEILSELDELKNASNNDDDQAKFKSLEMGTECVIFIKMKSQYDPVILVQQIFQSLVKESKPQSRFLQRLVPAPKTCNANLNDIVNLAREQCSAVFDAKDGKSLKFSIQVRMRLHNKTTRMEIIDAVADAINPAIEVDKIDGAQTDSEVDKEPKGGARPTRTRHTVDLTHPDFIVLIEIIKSSCILCLVPASEYEACKKYNVQMVNEMILKTGGECDGDTGEASKSLNNSAEKE